MDHAGVVIPLERKVVEDLGSIDERIGCHPRSVREQGVGEIDLDVSRSECGCEVSGGGRGRVVKGLGAAVVPKKDAKVGLRVVDA